MTSLILEYPRGEAKTLVKASFEACSKIFQYHDDGHRVVGKTRSGLSSHGEQIIVEIPENQSQEDETMITISAGKEVSVNVTASPEKAKSAYIESLEGLRGHEIDEILDEMNRTIDPEDSKEVESSTQLRDGSTNVAKIWIIMMVLSFLFMIVMMAAITP